ncbi:MAG: 4Fe-4S dicluster domain-containing protein [Anaerolineae bacterium]
MNGESASRREFFRMCAVGVVAAGAAILGLKNLGAQPKPLSLSEGVIMPDPSLCIGCLTCEVVCSQYHRDQGLSDMPRIRILNHPETELHSEIQRKYPGRGEFLQQPCKQCPHPECVYVCPVDAMKVDEETGARFIDESACVACGRCEAACPFPVDGVLTETTEPVHWKRIFYDDKKNVYTKCDMCRGREEGPICVERCPINIRIRQGVLKTDTMCLDVVKATSKVYDGIA